MFCLAAASPSQTGASLEIPFKSVAVLPIKAKGKARKEILDVLDDLVLSTMQGRAQGMLKVVGKSDIDTMLGYERTKESVGCDDAACAVQIAGALGVDSIVAPTVGTLGKKWMLTLVWIDQRESSVFRRHSEDLGTSEEDFDAGVSRAVARLFGISVPSNPTGVSGNTAQSNAAPNPAKGYALFYNGHLSKSEASFTYVQAVADCIESVKTLGQLPISCDFDGKRIGYELIWDGTRAGYEPGWTMEQAKANCAANTQRYRDKKVVECHFDGQRFTM